MGKTIKLKRGYDIKIVGEPKQETVNNLQSRTYSIKPPNFEGMYPIPKLLVQVGDEVKAGDGLFFDKSNPDIIYASPVSGEVVEVRRGLKRAIVEVIILADNSIAFKQFDKINLASTTKEAIIPLLLQSGCWAFLRQRPYNVVASPNDTPKNIFISGFDTAPLAPDYNYVMQGQGKYFQAGVDVLKYLTSGKVHLSVNGGATLADAYKNVKGIEIHQVSGPHPSGTVGTQIHHIAPLAKGEVVWTINPQDVLVLGRLALEGVFNTERLVSLGGPVVKEPKYYKTYLGANVENMVKGNLTTDHVRYISGNPLTGSIVESNGHLDFWHHQLTVLKEGDQYEMFGWILPGLGWILPANRPSASKTFPAFLKPNKKYDVTTNTHGEHRAFVVTGLYEKVTPMDIYPMQLLKSIMYGDFDQMEGLGIYEVVEEDLALCGFVCPSKTEVQEILRQGLDMMREQG
ncbi:MAG: Na(+)-translocating NADH-quinone reductase subunit A [Chitinophagales bacterium]